MGKFIDLTGRRFGKLTVVERIENHITSGGNCLTQWKCICDCQNDLPDEEKQFYITLGNALTGNKRVSCGCDKSERKRIKMKEYHSRNRSTYDLSKDYGIGCTYDGHEFYFDIEDYDKIKDFNWHVNDQGYIVALIEDSDNKRGYSEIRMHRVIMDVNKKKDEVDHIHGKSSRNDNRKSNLRVVTHSQNNMNKGIMKRNTSGYTGVDYVKRINKWRARIHVNKKEISLGLFDNIEDAINARRQGEEKYFGQYSYINSISKEGN